MNMKINKMNYWILRPKKVMYLAFYVLLLGFCSKAVSQADPVITIRFANPHYDCLNAQYCVDVEYRSNVLGQQVFGTNVRFFYPDTLLALVGFSDFQGGYGPVFPDPPMVTNSPFAGPALFGFVGSADFVNGGVQLNDPLAPPIFLDTLAWTKLFQVCFVIVDPNPNIQSFCPSLVWDLQEDPANGGYLIGDDGVVITLVDPAMIMESIPADENVEQFNWVYTNPVTPPYGMPVEQVCTSLDCSPLIMCAVDTTIECDESTSPDVTGFATATDICDGDPTITFSDMTMVGNCPNNLTITRTWIAINACDLADTCVQLITVIDTTAPSVFCPADLTVQCANQVPTPDVASVGVEDNCSGEGTVTFVDDVISNQTCTNRYTLTRTYRATDVCGNSGTCSQTITVYDDTAPGITCPADVTVQCANQVPAPAVGVVTSTDNCGGMATITHVGDAISGQTCTNRFTVTRTYRATDECGNSATCNQTITVFDNTAPSITCPADVTVQCASLVPAPNTASVSSSDNCGGAATITHVGDVISGQTCTNRYSVTRTYRATDECGNSATCNQIITVFDNTPPAMTCPAAVTVQCATQVPAPDIASVTTTDNCGGSATVAFLSDVNSNQTCANRYTVTRTYSAIDECGNSATCNQLITVFDNTPPALTCPPNVTFQCASQLPTPNVGLVTSTDNCTGLATITFVGDAISGQTCTNRFTVTRTYRATDACGNTADCNQMISIFDNTPPSITCPANMTVTCASGVPAPNTGSVTSTDNCNGAATITFDGDAISSQICANSYTIARTYRATDECGNTATCNQLITVIDQSAPSITCPANVSVSCTGLVPAVNTASVTASDNCGGIASVTFVGDVISGQVCANQYTITRTYRASDACGNSATCSQLIVVNDVTAPSITCPVNVTVSCASQVPAANPASVTTSDNCAAAATVTFVGDVISNQTCTNRYTVTRTYRAMDACGNSATCSQTITVNDQTAPSITCPANVTVACANLVPAVNTANVTTSDNCGGAATVTFVSDVISNQTCANRYTVTRTYRSTDACGNSATCSQNITVNDITAPTLTCPANVTVQFGDSTMPANTGNPMGSDNCTGAAPGFTFSDAITPGNCNQQFTINRTWTATDACGLTASCTQVIQVAFNCCMLPPIPVISGDQYVCPDETVTYTVSGYDPMYTYNWTLNGGGTIVNTSGATVTVHWDNTPGGPFTLQVAVVVFSGCQVFAYLPIYIQGVQTLACGDHIQLSLDQDCQSVVLSSMILVGPQYGDNYIVIIYDENGNVIPNATLTYEHIGRTFTVKVLSECNGQSCWGTVSVEDKLPPHITCVCPAEGVGLTNFTGTLDANSPVFTRPNTMPQGGTCTPGQAGVPYQSFPFYLNMAGNNQFDVVTFTAPSADSFIALYQDSFDPTQPCKNLVAADDDNGAGFLSQIVATLEANRTYIMVMTTFNNSGNDFGDFVINITSNANVFLVDPACQITCLEVDQLVNGIIPPGLQPEVTDNCGTATVEIVNTDANFDNCEGGFITVTWQATDLGGNTARCVQKFNIIPLTLDDLTFPDNYIGQCGGSVNPAITGWPHVNGVPVTDAGGVCNIFAGYWDKELNECGGGRKIVRTWTVLDWCTVQIVEGIQVIKLIDDQGPTLTCPANLTVGTDFWYCYANVSVPKPVAHDNCSSMLLIVCHQPEVQ